MKIAVLAILLACPAAAAEVHWAISAATAAFVGSETNLTYRPLPMTTELKPDVLASATTSFAIVKVAGGKDGSWTWTVLPLEEGTSSFVARWKVAGKENIAAEPVTLAVRAPDIAKDAEIADIKGPLAAKHAWWPWLLAAGLGALGWETWRRLKARRGATHSFATAEPPLAPETAAERALEALAAQGLWERGEYAAYYFRLTEILRSYLEARYDEPATAMTSVEVARLVKAREPSLGFSASVRELLQRADFVKFARTKPETNEGPRDLESVRGIVMATSRRESAAPSGVAK